MAAIRFAGTAGHSLYPVHEFLRRVFHIVCGKLAIRILPLWAFIPFGITHAVRDFRRDARLQRQGFKVLRFWNNDVDRNLVPCR